MTPKEALNWLRSNKTWLNTNKVPEVVYEAIEQALNELERLKKFKETFDNYELAKKQDFIAYENWLECEKERDMYFKAFRDIESGENVRKVLERTLT